MRDFFIGAFEKLVGLIVILMILVVIAGAVVAFLDTAQAGPLAALAIVLIGSLYVVLMAGMMYLFLGIYHNTKRSAAALEKLVDQ